MLANRERFDAVRNVRELRLDGLETEYLSILVICRINQNRISTSDQLSAGLGKRKYSKWK